MDGKVSVVIPSYNYSAYISDAIDSIMAQTYPHWEIIVVDDGSRDNTAEVVAQYTAQDSRIKYHYQQNQGLSAARNTGISLAQGEYIQLLDADDYISKRKLEIQVGLLEQYSDVALVYADTYIYTHSDDPTVPRNFRQFHLTMPPISSQGVGLVMHMTLDNIFLVGSPLFRRSMAVAAGPFDRNLSSLEDWHFWYRAALQNQKFVYDNQEGTEFYVRTHGNNMTGNRYKMWKYKIQARQALIGLIENMIQSGAGIGPALHPVLAKQREYLYEELARYNLLYESIGVGIANHFRYLMHGNKPLHIWYDSAYWLKERLLGHNRKIA
jgi:glycosyltransferase involved in cell wall biosynthesis